MTEKNMELCLSIFQNFGLNFLTKFHLARISVLRFQENCFWGFHSYFCLYSLSEKVIVLRNTSLINVLLKTTSKNIPPPSTKHCE